MRIVARLTLTSCVLVAGLAMSAHWSANARSPAQTQLACLNGVNLTVSVDRGFSAADALEKEIRGRAKRILADAGLSDEGPDGVWLSIRVTLHPSSKTLRPEDLLVQVEVELSEHVRLDRDRSIKVPQGAVTWSQDSISIEAKADLRDRVMKQVDWAVGLFTDSVKSVRRLPAKDVHDGSR